MCQEFQRVRSLVVELGVVHAGCHHGVEEFLPPRIGHGPDPECCGIPPIDQSAALHLLELEVEQRLAVVRVHRQHQLHAGGIVAGHAGLEAGPGRLDEGAHRFGFLVEERLEPEHGGGVVLIAFIGQQQHDRRFLHLGAQQERVLGHVALLDRGLVRQERRR